VKTLGGFENIVRNYGYLMSKAFAEYLPTYFDPVEDAFEIKNCQI
jgi:hypothetical protein